VVERAENGSKTPNGVSQNKLLEKGKPYLITKGNSFGVDLFCSSIPSG
jgi:hypothetical protein